MSIKLYSKLLEEVECELRECKTVDDIKEIYTYLDVVLKLKTIMAQDVSAEIITESRVYQV